MCTISRFWRQKSKGEVWVCVCVYNGASVVGELVWCVCMVNLVAGALTVYWNRAYILFAKNCRRIRRKKNPSVRHKVIWPGCHISSPQVRFCVLVGVCVCPANTVCAARASRACRALEPDQCQKSNLSWLIDSGARDGTTPCQIILKWIG